MKKTRVVVLFALLLPAAGCIAPYLVGLNEKTMPEGAPTELSFAHSDSCGRSQLSDNLDPGQKVYQLMCSYSRDMGDFRSDLYARIDDRKVDHLDVALLLVTCVATGRCNSHAIAADAYYFAMRTSTAEVQSAVAPLKIRDDFKKAFITRAEACRKQVVDQVTAWGAPWQRVYVKTIAETRDRRLADEDALARFYKLADEIKTPIDAAVLDGKVTPALRAKAVALRDEYVSACVARGRALRYCLTGPVARPLTEQIVRLSIALRDPVMGEAENEVLALGVDQSDVRVEIHEAVKAAMAAETERASAYKKAKDAGSDPRLLATRFGDPAPVDLSDYNIDAGLEPPAARNFHGDLVPLGNAVGVEHVESVVSRVDRRGDRAVISFREELVQSSTTTGCRETNKVDRITPQGEIVYREVCDERTETTRDRAAPITVPVAEAARLAPGNFVVAVSGTKKRDGYVLQVFSAGGQKDPIQLRSFALKK
jgi:hypothetical protein